MHPIPIDCPHCGSSNQFYLWDAERHLRQCPACDGWFVFSEDSANSGVEALVAPITCPVDGCEASPAGDDLPAHIIGEHDGELD